MSTLNRALQLEILKALAEIYPRGASAFRFSETAEHAEVARNIHYLHEHGLVSASFTQFVEGPIDFKSPKITAKGLDFLADDGGLSAILGVVTVRIDGDTMRQLMIRRVEESDEDPGVKAQIIEAIKEAPGHALVRVSERVLQEGIQRIPDAVDMLRKLFGL